MSTSTYTTTYTEDHIRAIRDERTELIDSLYGHYASCADCFIALESNEEDACRSAQLIADELFELDRILGYTDKTDKPYDKLSFYYDGDTDQDDDIVTPYSDLVAEYVTTADERPAEGSDPTIGQTPTVDPAWLTREASRPSDPAGMTALPEDVAESTTAWIDHEFQAIVINLVDYNSTAANFQALLRIWTTPRGEVGIYKTFIKNVTNDSFEAYCSVCKRGMVLAKTTRNVLSTVLHAHTHVPDSVVDGELSEQHLFLSLNGTDSYADPGNHDADIAYVKRYGQWVCETEKIRARENGTYESGPTGIYRAWQEWLAQLK